MVVGFLILIWIFVDRRRRTYTVTTGKVIMESGLVAKSSDEVRIKDIRSISASGKGGLTGLFGVGDLEFRVRGQRPGGNHLSVDSAR